MSLAINLSQARRLLISRGLLLALYLLASGPLYAGLAQRPFSPLYEPLGWARQHTPLAIPLNWYWGLFQGQAPQVVDSRP